MVDNIENTRQKKRNKYREDFEKETQQFFYVLLKLFSIFTTQPAKFSVTSASGRSPKMPKLWRKASTTALSVSQTSSHIPYTTTSLTNLRVPSYRLVGRARKSSCCWKDWRSMVLAIGQKLPNCSRSNRHNKSKNTIWNFISATLTIFQHIQASQNSSTPSISKRRELTSARENHKCRSQKPKPIVALDLDQLKGSEYPTRLSKTVITQSKLWAIFPSEENSRSTTIMMQNCYWLSWSSTRTTMKKTSELNSE
jgi:hypothetical protein